MQARAIVHVANRQVVLAERSLTALNPTDVLVKMRYSAISPGTESLIFNGDFSMESALDENIKNLAGNFTYPFAYGYAAVGEVIDTGASVDSAWLGQRVFTFHPHQDLARVSVDDCVVIPESIDCQDALFLANMESATGIVMDAMPVIGERLLLFGQGVVGLLVTALCSRFPLSMLACADPIASRREQAIVFGATDVLNPLDSEQWEPFKARLFESIKDGMDAVIELSGNMQALNLAIGCAGMHSRVVIGSWYGTRLAPVNLGEEFHRRRLRLISSQVSHIGPCLSGRWDKTRRFSLAWEMIQAIRPTQLVTHLFTPTQCQQAYEIVSQRQDGVLQAVIDYGDTQD